MSFSTAQISNVKGLLTRYGKLGSVSISRETTGALDPVEGEVTGSTTTETPLLAATLAIKSSMVDGERIRATDRRFISDADFKPIESDTIIVDGAKNEIVNIKTYRTADVVIAYEVVYRG